MKKINFKFDSKVTDSFDIIRILKNAPRNIELNLIYINIPRIVILSTLQMFRSKLFNQTGKIHCLWCAKTSLATLKLISYLKIFGLVQLIQIQLNIVERHLFMWKHPKKYIFDCCKLLDEFDVVKAYKTKFPDHSPMSECELIIPMKYLYSADYGRKNIHSLLSHKDKLEFMNEISKAQKISCSISYCSELQYLSEWASLFPQKFRYSFLENSKPDNWNKFESYFKSMLDFYSLEDFSNIKLEKIYVLYELSESSYEFIRRLLLLPSVQSYLLYIWLELPKLSQTLSILSILSDCPFIEYVELRYRENDNEVDSSDLIKSSMNSFTKKVGIIEYLKINLG